MTPFLSLLSLPSLPSLPSLSLSLLLKLLYELLGVGLQCHVNQNVVL